MSTEKCTSCLARIKVNSGQHSPQDHAHAQAECTCDVLNKVQPTPKVDWVAPAKRLPWRTDPAWATDDSWGGQSAAIRCLEDG